MANKTDIMRLLGKGVSQGEIARRLHCSKTTVSGCARILREQGIDAEALTELDEPSIRQGFFSRPEHGPDGGYVQPDFEGICKRLESNRRLTLKETWFQYSSIEPDGRKLYSYSQFCRRLKSWSKGSSVTTRMRYVPGQACFFDWAGLTGQTTDRMTGRRQKVYLFVACLPYSALIYAEGFYSLAQAQWLSGHMASFEYFSGVPRVLVPDQCATATDRTPAYVTEVNQTYYEFADYYGCAVDPARRGRPRDKGMVESAVNLVEQWVIASLAEDVFYTLEEYNAEVMRKVDWLNDRPFQQREGSRRSVFEEEEKDELGSLPPARYEMVSWGKATVGPNSHVKVDYRYYSVPFAHVGERLDVRLTSGRVDVLSDGMVVASHERLYGKKGGYATAREHMPSTWGVLDNPWTPDRFTRWAAGVGPAAAEAIGRVLSSRSIVEQAFVPCQNILGLAKSYGKKRLEAACAEVCRQPSAVPTYASVKEAIASMGRRAAGQAPMEAEAPGGDRVKGRGRTRGADHYRIKGDEG